MRWIGDQGLSRFSVRAVPQAFLSGTPGKNVLANISETFSTYSQKVAEYPVFKI
jgi:hypothetical protein